MYAEANEEALHRFSLKRVFLKFENPWALKIKADYSFDKVAFC